MRTFVTPFEWRWFLAGPPFLIDVIRKRGNRVLSGIMIPVSHHSTVESVLLPLAYYLDGCMPNTAVHYRAWRIFRDVCLAHYNSATQSLLTSPTFDVVVSRRPWLSMFGRSESNADLRCIGHCH